MGSRGRIPYCLGCRPVVRCRCIVVDSAQRSERPKLSNGLSEYLISLSVALQRHAMYPDGHPSLGPAVDAVMRRAVLKKFETHADIRALLLSTGDEKLVEKTTDDHYWGVGTNGTGKNRLGQILMEVRQILRDRARSAQPASGAKED